MNMITRICTEIAEKVQHLFEAGKKAEYDAFWNEVLDNGKRDTFSSCFSRWGSEYIRPNRKVTPTNASSCMSLFEYCEKLKKVEAEYFDFSQKAKGTNHNSGYYVTFRGCRELEEIEDVGFVAQYSYYQSFYGCLNLKKIARIGTDEDTIFDNTFYNCLLLEDVTFDGVIGKNIDFKDCTKLNKESITSAMNARSTTATFTVTFSKEAVDKAFETAEGANDGSTSAEWIALKNERPNVTVDLV